MAERGRTNGLSSLLILIIGAVLHIPASAAQDNWNSGEDKVSWDVSEFGPCTSQCGGGLQVRSVRCVQHISIPGYPDTIPAAHSLCPQPAPPDSQACNTHSCLAQWTTLEWSECSATCGKGTQTREVRCETTTWSANLRLPGGTGHQVSANQCAGSRPADSRDCHVAFCPLLADPEKSAILAENYTLWQINKAKRLKADIGGQLNVLPGQDLIIRCPVRERSLRKLRYWSRENKLLPVLGNHLVIHNADPARHAATYTCAALNDDASITIKFIEEGNPVPEFYKQWMQNSIRKRREKRRASGLPATVSPFSEEEDTYLSIAPSGRRTLAVNTGSRLDLQQRDQPEKFRDFNRRWSDKIRGSRKRTKQQQDEKRAPKRTLKRRQLGPEFMVGNWSECERATCQKPGQKSRVIKCVEYTNKYMKLLPEERCLEAGLLKPDTVSQCAFLGVCPLWRAGSWSECGPQCGRVGYRTRYLTCVWSDSGTYAFNACDRNNKPVTAKPCKPDPCTGSYCRDQSSSCPLAARLRMCRYTAYRRQCCHSCRTRRRRRKARWKNKYRYHNNAYD